MVRHHVGECEPSGGQQDQDQLDPTNQPQPMARRRLITGHPSEYNTPPPLLPPLSPGCSLKTCNKGRCLQGPELRTERGACSGVDHSCHPPLGLGRFSLSSRPIWASFTGDAVIFTAQSSNEQDRSAYCSRQLPEEREHVRDVSSG